MLDEAAAIIRDSITEFCKIQKWMISAKEKIPETYNSMYDRYLELKVTLTSPGVNLSELDKIKQ